jgi:O-methyltransferase
VRVKPIPLLAEVVEWSLFDDMILPMSPGRYRPTETREAKQYLGQHLYLDLLKQVLTRYLFGETHRPVAPARGTIQRWLFLPVQKTLDFLGVELMRRVRFDPAARAEGRDWPVEAETMIGLRRLDNLEECITTVLREEVPGDLMETGVWRGGSVIFMKAVLEAYGDAERVVWAADSFEGVPKPDPKRYPKDADDEYRLWSWTQLAAPLEVVRANFRRYGLLDERVRFLKGWFRDTLPNAPVERLAILRLDGDLYESTIIALRSLYKKVSTGGYVIVDDYGAIDGCKAAVEDFRSEEGVSEELHWIDWGAVYWRVGG